MGLNLDKKQIELELKEKHFSYNNIIKLSVSDELEFDNSELQPIPDPESPTHWVRGTYHCNFEDDGTGLFVGTKVVDTIVEIYNATGIPTGQIANNTPDHPGYIPPVVDAESCRPYTLQWIGEESTAECIKEEETLPTYSFKWIGLESNAYCEQTTLIGNMRMTGIAQTQCESGQTGDLVEYVVEANTYFAETQQAANALAQADVDANKQQNANENGNCTIIPVNEVQASASSNYNDIGGPSNDGFFTISVSIDQPLSENIDVNVYCEYFWNNGPDGVGGTVTIAAGSTFGSISIPFTRYNYWVNIEFTRITSVTPNPAGGKTIVFED